MTNKCTIWIPVLLAAGICIALCGLVSAASPQLPCEFYGAATIGGSPAPAGSTITAYVNGTSQGTLAVTEAGKFGGLGTFDERLIVMAGENDFANGVPTITFKINGQAALQSAPYQPGASTQLNLSAEGQAVVPAPATPQGNNSTEVPVIVAQVPAVPLPTQAVVTPTPTPAPTPVQNQSVQAVNYTATQPSCSAAPAQ